MSLTSLLYKLARMSADVNAVSKGKVGKRISNRIIGKVAGRTLRGVWRR